MSLKAFRVGPLPANQINKAVDLELEVGDVWVSRACHSHMKIDHPEDYPLIKAYIVDIITDPTWVGQDPKHGGNIYLVRKLPVERETGFALIAVGLEMTEYGTYSVRSAYAIKREDVDTRILRGSLRQVLPM